MNYHCSEQIYLFLRGYLYSLDDYPERLSDFFGQYSHEHPDEKFLTAFWPEQLFESHDNWVVLTDKAVLITRVDFPEDEEEIRELVAIFL